MTLRVLVIDDDRAHCEATAEIVRRLGHDVATAPGGETGIARLREGGIDVVVTDLVMRDRSGLDVIAAATGGPEVIVVTGYGSDAAAPAVRRAGAAAYLVKPLGVEMFRRVLSGIARRVEGRRPRAPGTAFMGMVGGSPAMEHLFDLIRRVAESHATVLIEGESGTGKELVARAVHDLSPRAGGPFLPVNCASLSAGLLESELFGHEKGAFTGAHASRVGRFEAADGGTLFLDEIGEMDLGLQAKLLRALEDHEVVPVGSNDARPVDLRVIAATNRPLRARVGEGTFREDLFYRLNVVRVAVPALRARTADIPRLVDAFLDEMCAEHSLDRPEIDPEVHAWLAAQAWPGNVRELRNWVETTLLTGPGTRVTLADLPPEARGGLTAAPTSAPLSMRPIAEVERELIRNTLTELSGNRARAARALGISTRTLYRRIKELGLS